MQRYSSTVANACLPLDERMTGRYGYSFYLADDVDTAIAALRRKWEAGEANAVTNFLAEFSADSGKP